MYRLHLNNSFKETLNFILLNKKYIMCSWFVPDWNFDFYEIIFGNLYYNNSWYMRELLFNIINFNVKFEKLLLNEPTGLERVDSTD